MERMATVLAKKYPKKPDLVVSERVAGVAAHVCPGESSGIPVV